MIKILSKTLLFFILLSTTCCGVIVEPMPKSWNWGAKSRPLTGVRNFPEADTDYGRGFKDGCEGIWVVVAKGAVDFMKPTLNPTLMSKNPDYSSGWFDGMEQCTYILDWDVL
jgi:hypothetical protein